MKPLIDWESETVVEALDRYLDFEKVKKSFKPPGVPKTAAELCSYLTEITGVVINRGSINNQIVKRRVQRAQTENPSSCPEVVKNYGKRRPNTDGPKCDVKKAKNHEPLVDASVSFMDVSNPPCEVTDEGQSDDVEHLHGPSLPPAPEPHIPLPPPSVEDSADTVSNRKKTSKLASKTASKGKGSSNRKREQKTPVTYFRALNSKLNKNHIVVPCDADTVRVYFIKDTKKGKSYAKCLSKTCSSTGILNDATGEFVVDSHDTVCTPKPASEFNDGQCSREARNLARHGERIGDAHWKGFERATEKEGGDHYPEYFEHKTQLSRWNKKFYGEEPTTMKNGEPWRRSKTEFSEVYMTDSAARALARCEIVVADATFEVCPHGYSQVLTMHELTKNAEGLEEYNCLMFALMKNKAESTYNEVIKAIQDVWNTLGETCQIKRLHTDYEAAEQNAFAKLVGKDHVYGCLFHFSKACLKHLGMLGLYPYYQLKVDGKYAPEYLSIRIYIRCLLALPCLPKEDAQWLWKLLRNPPKAPNDEIYWPSKLLEDFLSYYESTWINKKDNTWTFFKLGRVRNTNGAESFHSAQAKTNYSKPRLAQFLVRRRLLAESVNVRLRKLEKSGTRVKPQNRQYDQVRKRIQAMELEYEERRETYTSDHERAVAMMRFARQIASTLHDVQNKSGKTTKDAKKRDLKAALDESIKFRQGLGLHDGALLAALLRQEEEMMSESLVSDAEYDQYDPIVVKIRSEPKTGNEANREDKIEEELPVSMDNCEALSVPVNVTTNVKIESETANNSEVMIESENGPTKMTQPASSEILYDGGKSGNVQKCLQPSTEFLKTLSCKYGWRFDHNPHLFMTIEDVRTTKPLTTHDVDGDGNCGFRALSYALTGCEDNHKLIREKVANYVYYDHAPKRFYKAHPTAKTNSMMKQYTAKSPLDKARWMSTSDMVAAACLLGVNILSFSDDLTWKLNNRNSISGKTGVMNDGPSILLDNSSRIHFQVVTNVTQK